MKKSVLSNKGNWSRSDLANAFKSLKDLESIINIMNDQCRIDNNNISKGIDNYFRSIETALMNADGW